MLPRQAYVDPEVFEWEQRAIFSGWTCVGHAADLAAVGSQRAVGSGANAMLLVRGEDGAPCGQGYVELVGLGGGRPLSF
mgnify:CR=1 FL=1